MAFKITASEKKMILARRKVEAEINDKDMYDAAEDVSSRLMDAFQGIENCIQGFKERKDKKNLKLAKDHKKAIAKANAFFSKIEQKYEE